MGSLKQYIFTIVFRISVQNAFVQSFVFVIIYEIFDAASYYTHHKRITYKFKNFNSTTKPIKTSLTLLN